MTKILWILLHIMIIKATLNQCSNYTVGFGGAHFFFNIYIYIYIYNGGGGGVRLQWLTKMHNSYKCMHYLHYLG